MARKILLAILTVSVLIFCFLYFDAPMNMLRPAFHKNIVNKYAGIYKVDPLLITAMIKTESNFIKHAKSYKGAVGLMQLMPATAKALAAELGMKDFHEQDLEKPDLNIKLGVYYVSKLLIIYKDNLILTLAAYNAGMTKVETWYIQNPSIEVNEDGIPYQETREYIKSVLGTYKWLTEAQQLKKLVKKKAD